MIFAIERWWFILGNVEETDDDIITMGSHECDGVSIQRRIEFEINIVSRLTKTDTILCIAELFSAQATGDRFAAFSKGVMFWFKLQYKWFLEFNLQ